MSEVQKSDETPVPGAAAPDTQNRRRRRWPVIVAAAFFGVFIFGSVGFLGATTLEEHDGFCASCHTVPETTYVQRASAALDNTNAPVADLSTYHYHQAQAKGQSFDCIECHRGDSSLPERFQTLALGGQDTVTFVMGKADPTLEKTTISQPNLVNAACISCHTATLLTVKGNQTHFHNWLPQTAALIAQGQKLITTNNNGRGNRLRTANTSLTCTSCHLAHKTVDTSNAKMMLADQTITQAACDSCHQAAGTRPQSLDRLLNGRGED